MRKLIVALAMLAVVVALASPVSAQDAFQAQVANVFETVNTPVRVMGQIHCDNAAPGSPEWLSWCQGIETDHYGRPTGYNPNSVRGQRARGYHADELRRNRYWRERYNYGGGYYGGYPVGYGGYGGYGYGPDIQLNGRNIGAVLGGIGGGIATRNSRSGWVKAGGIVGGAVLGGILGNQVDRRNERRDEVRFERTYRSEAPAPVEPPAERETVQEQQTAPSPTRQTVEEAGRTDTVYSDGGWLCNDTQTAIVVLVDGKPVGKLAAGQMVELSTLPSGKVTYKKLG
jgi:uncharacterized protein YcfJ